MRPPPATALAAVLALSCLALPPAGADLPPGQTVDQTEVCLSCHDLEEALGAAVPHAPVVAGDCSACHNPHVSRFDALLRQRPASLCVSCHSEVQQELERPIVHRPVAEGRCAECHAPHGGANDKLLLKSGTELCASCHAAIAEWTGRAVQHSPFERGRCSTCHEPHAAPHEALAAQPGGGVCASCHPVTAAFRQRHAGYPVDRADCQQCHDPHASSRTGLFRSELHPPFEEGECTTCHSAPSSGDPFALTASQSKLCGDCHDEQVEDSVNAAFPHLSAGGGSCTSCHNPHGGDGAGLLQKSQQALCLDCHDPGGSTSGQKGRFVTHAGDIECSTCHAPHGGRQPLLLQLDPVVLCGECHAHEHGVRHPLGEEVKDPRTGSPMTCLSCHGIHDAPYDKYLHRSDERDLCVGCHKDIGAQ